MGSRLSSRISGWTNGSRHLDEDGLGKSVGCSWPSGVLSPYACNFNQGLAGSSVSVTSMYTIGANPPEKCVTFLSRRSSGLARVLCVYRNFVNFSVFADYRRPHNMDTLRFSRDGCLAISRLMGINYKLKHHKSWHGHA